MKIEMERKFLLGSDIWRSLVARSETIRDGLLNLSADIRTRVRINGRHSTLTVKTKRLRGQCEEFEYDIPLEDAERLISHCGDNVIYKERHYVNHAGLIWEIDEYKGVLNGIVLAEVELETFDQTVVLPDWVGREVTSEPQYRKINMLQAARSLTK